MEDAQQYLEQHKIPDLLNHITEALVYARPPRVTSYLVKMLKHMQQVRDDEDEDKLMSGMSINHRDNFLTHPKT